MYKVSINNNLVSLNFFKPYIFVCINIICVFCVSYSLHYISNIFHRIFDNLYFGILERYITKFIDNNYHILINKIFLFFIFYSKLYNFSMKYKTYHLFYENLILHIKMRKGLNPSLAYKVVQLFLCLELHIFLQ